MAPIHRCFKNGDRGRPSLKFVGVVAGYRDDWFQTLARADLGDQPVAQTALFVWVRVDEVPVVEHALWEGFPAGVGAQVLGEPEGFSNWKVGLQVDHRGPLLLLFVEHAPTSAGDHTVAATHDVLGHLDLGQVHGLHEGRAGAEHGGVGHAAGGGDDLASTTVDGVGVQGNVLDLEQDTTAVFVGHRSFLGGPLEPANEGVLDLVQVLDPLGGVDQKVRAGPFWAEAPDLAGLSDVPPGRESLGRRAG